MEALLSISYYLKLFHKKGDALSPLYFYCKSFFVNASTFLLSLQEDLATKQSYISRFLPKKPAMGLLRLPHGRLAMTEKVKVSSIYPSIYDLRLHLGLPPHS